MAVPSSAQSRVHYGTFAAGKHGRFCPGRDASRSAGTAPCPPPQRQAMKRPSCNEEKQSAEHNTAALINGAETAPFDRTKERRRQKEHACEPLYTSVAQSAT